MPKAVITTDRSFLSTSSLYKKFPYLGQPELSTPAYLMHLEPVPKISRQRRKPLEADLGSERDLDRKKCKITFRDVG